MTIRELGTDADISGAFHLAAQLRDRIRADTFLSEVRRQQAQGYALVGGFDGDRLVALAGIRRMHTLARGEHLFVDDLVTDVAVRGAGYGREMMEWLIARARAERIPRVHLDSRITARGFYEKIGFTFHTSVPCWIDVDPGDPPR